VGWKINPLGVICLRNVITTTITAAYN